MKSLLKVIAVGIALTLLWLVLPWPLRVGFILLGCLCFFRRLMLLCVLLITCVSFGQPNAPFLGVKPAANAALTPTVFIVTYTNINLAQTSYSLPPVALKANVLYLGVTHMRNSVSVGSSYGQAFSNENGIAFTYNGGVNFNTISSLQENELLVWNFKTNVDLASSTFKEVQSGTSGEIGCTVVLIGISNLASGVIVKSNYTSLDLQVQFATNNLGSVSSTNVLVMISAKVNNAANATNSNMPILLDTFGDSANPRAETTVTATNASAMASNWVHFSTAFRFGSAGLELK